MRWGKRHLKSLLKATQKYIEMKHRANSKGMICIADEGKINPVELMTTRQDGACILTHNYPSSGAQQESPSVGGQSALFCATI